MKLKTYLKKLDNDKIISIGAEDGIRVIIKGSEKGDFWFKSEFDKKYC